MKAVKANITRGLQIGSTLTCADNSGAQELKIIAVENMGTVRQRRQNAGIADLVHVRATKGDRDVKGEIHQAVVVRQRKEFKRPEGVRVRFEDNAAVLVDATFMPKGTKIKGAIAKEAVERWPLIGKVASMVT